MPVSPPKGYRSALAIETTAPSELILSEEYKEALTMKTRFQLGFFRLNMSLLREKEN